MVSTSPLSRMTTPLPSLWLPSVPAVKASSGIDERRVTIDRRIGSIFMFSFPCAHSGSKRGTPHQQQTYRSHNITRNPPTRYKASTAGPAYGLRKFQYRVPEGFRPHLTVSYNRQFLPARPIEPITFVVKEFVLVHSRLWFTQYRILRRWRLH